MTVTVVTSTLPLTTTFTPPADCFKQTWHFWGNSGHWWRAGDGVPTACFPYSYRFKPEATVIYSPGICPVGFSSACNTVRTSGTQTDTIVSCCESGFSCHAADPTRTWESEFSCAKSISIDRSYWSIPAKDQVIPSVYNYAVLVISATPTPSSTFSSSSASSPAPASTSSPSQASPTATNPPVVSPAKEDKGLSTGAKAGIGIGTALGVAALALIGFLLWRLGQASARTKERERHQVVDDYAQDPTIMAHYWQPPLEMTAEERVEIAAGRESKAPREGGVHELQGS